MGWAALPLLDCVARWIVSTQVPGQHLSAARVHAGVVEGGVGGRLGGSSLGDGGETGVDRPPDTSDGKDQGEEQLDHVVHFSNGAGRALAAGGLMGSP